MAKKIKNPRSMVGDFFSSHHLSDHEVRVLREMRVYEATPPDKTFELGRLYADVVAERILLEYVARYALELMPHHRCLRPLVTGRQCNELQGKCITFPMDHTFMWKRNGKPFVLTTQPYQLDMKDLQEMCDVCEEHHLEVEVSTNSWHFPGSTLLVEVHRQGWRSDFNPKEEAQS